MTCWNLAHLVVEIVQSNGRCDARLRFADRWAGKTTPSFLVAAAVVVDRQTGDALRGAAQSILISTDRGPRLLPSHKLARAPDAQGGTCCLRATQRAR